MDIQKHNSDALKLCEENLNETGHRSVFIIGTKKGEKPKLVSFSFLHEDDILGFLRQTADLIEQKEIDVDYIDLTEK